MSSDPPSGNTIQITGNQNITGSHNNITIQNITQPLPDPMGHKAGYQAITPPRPFIDRKKEREALGRAMLAGEARLISGLGGVGKTALALRVAQDLADAGKFPEGILWIPLEGNPAPETVAVWVLGAFGMKPEGNAIDAMAWALHRYCPLLILDNAEAAPQTADAILDCRGKAAVLVTSRNTRVGLNVIPDVPDDLSPMNDADAVNLLRSRLGSIKIEDTQVRELNKLVGGLPLALVLAAGFITRVLHRDPQPVDTYLDRLRHSPLTALELDHRRERSIQVAFDLSWKHLENQEKQVMMALTALPGDSADLSALVTVLSPKEDFLGRIFNKVFLRANAGSRKATSGRERIQSILWELGSFSLVIQSGNRYSLHPLLRSYVINQASSLKIKGLREHLERYYLNYAVLGKNENRYSEHINIEHDNILGAMAWARERQDWGKVSAFAKAVDFYLGLRGYSNLWLDCATWSLEAARQLRNRQEEADSLWRLGDVHYMLDDYLRAREQYEKALPIYRAIGDRQGEANTLWRLGDIQRMLAEYGMAQEHYEKAKRIYCAINDRLGYANALLSLGDVQIRLSETEIARERYEEALLIFRALNARLGEANAMRNLGDIHLQFSEYKAAWEKYENALSFYQTIGDHLGEANALQSLGNVHVSLLEYEAAGNRYEEALSLFRAIGSRVGEALSLRSLGDVHLQLAEFEAARKRYEEALGIYQSIGGRRGEAHLFLCLGDMFLQIAEYEAAQKRYEEALQIYRMISDHGGEANALKGLGDVHFRLTEYALAQKQYEESLRLFQAINEELGKANVLKGLGNIHFRFNDYGTAHERYKEALEIYRAAGNRHGEANVIRSFGEIHLKQAEYEAAQRDLTAALSLYQTMNNRTGIADSLRELGNVARCQQRWEDANKFYRQSMEICCNIKIRDDFAKVMAMQGRLAAAQEDNETARKLFNEALVIFQEIGSRHYITEIQGWLAELPEKNP